MSDIKTAVNLYGILDNELARMHELMQVYLKLPTSQPGSYSNNVSMNSNHYHMPVIFEKISKIQDVLLQAVVSHDKVLQDKVAELALTGVSNG